VSWNVAKQIPCPEEQVIEVGEPTALAVELVAGDEPLNARQQAEQRVRAQHAPELVERVPIGALQLAHPFDVLLPSIFLSAVETGLGALTEKEMPLEFGGDEALQPVDPVDDSLDIWDRPVFAGLVAGEHAA
jgi:hypothetical protein